MVKVLTTGVGRAVLFFFDLFGSWGLLCMVVFRAVLFGRRRFQVLLTQVMRVGITSQPVILITGAFTGAVLEAQTLFQLQMVHMESAGGAIVAIGMFRELGPVITGLMLAGRVGSAMAAEIGTMQVTEQILALRSMNIDPVDYLVKPRIEALLISMPILMMESVMIGIVSAYIVAVAAFDLEPAYWFKQMENFLSLADFYVSMTKSVVFGLIIGIVSCQQGLSTRNGAVGVGLSTMRAMVFSAIVILIANFLLTMIMNQIFPVGLSTGR